MEFRDERFEINLPPSTVKMIHEMCKQDYSCLKCKKDIAIYQREFNQFMLVPDLSVASGLLRMNILCGECGAGLQGVIAKFVKSKKKIRAGEMGYEKA